MRGARLVLLSLFWLKPLLLDAQQARYNDDQRNRRRQQQQQRQRQRWGQQPQEEDSENFQYFKDKFQDFFKEEQDENSFQQQVKQNYGHPRHIVEGLINTAIVSGSAFAMGTAALMGFPVLMWFAKTTTSDGVVRDDGGTVKILQIVVGAIIGGVVAIGCWLFAAAYGIWQIISGLYFTPPTLWAWITGRDYWKNGRWNYYNLTQHHEDILQSSTVSRKGVQDDSFYQILQVPTDASRKEIKRAYYKLAKEYQ
jgi:hypothetical protein